MSEKITVSIVIPNWNGKHLLAKNLSKVIAASRRSAEIIVVDDGSTDGSSQYIRDEFPQVRIITKTKHDGFASSVNEGVSKAMGNIVMLLNTDVVPSVGYLDALLPHFVDDGVFAVGCLEKSHENGKVVLRGRGEAKWKKGFFIHRRGEVDETTTAWVCGGSGAFRKTIWDFLGGMDILYSPFYWEDIDLSYRALKAGYKTLFEPTAVVVHEHEQGIIKQEYSSFQIKTIAYRNQFIFVWKNLSDFWIIAEHALWTPIRLAQAIVRGDYAMFVGYMCACICLPRVLSARLRASVWWAKKDRDIFTLS